MKKGWPPFLAPGPFLCLLLLACSDSTNPSSEENRVLDNTEAMLDSASAELANIDAAEIEAAEQNAPAPAD